MRGEVTNASGKMTDYGRQSIYSEERKLLVAMVKRDSDIRNNVAESQDM